MKFSRQEYWSGLPFPFPEYLPLDLPHCRQILYHLSRQGSPRLTWILIFSPLSLTGKHIWKKIFLKKEKNLKFSPLLNLLDSVATTTKSYFLTHFYNFCQICHRVTNSSTLAWKIPWTDELGGLQSMVSLRVGHDWATSLLLSLSCIGEENVNPLQCSCLENPKDRGAWWASLYGVAQSRTRLKRLSSSSSSSSHRVLFVRDKAVVVALDAKSYATLCNLVDCSRPGFSVLHYLPELFTFMSIESVMLSNHLILCHPFSVCL